MNSLEVAKACAQIAIEKRARDVLLLDIREMLGVSEYFVIATARNKRQMSAIANQIRVDLKQEGMKDLRVEGHGTDRWVLLDFGVCVIHVFDEQTRSFYDLESLWADAPRVNIDDLREPQGADAASPSEEESG